MAYFFESELAQWLDRLFSWVRISQVIFFFFLYILQHNQLTYQEKGNENLL